jgi:ribosome-associated translation inhibitor RaiA
MKNPSHAISIKFINTSASKAIENYILKKIMVKHENESSFLLGVKVQVSSEANHHNKKYVLTLEADMKSSGFIVRKTGLDIYQLIDEASDVYRKRLIKFSDIFSDRREKAKPLDELEVKEEDLIRENNKILDAEQKLLNNLRVDKYLILEEKSFDDNTPLHVEEAINLMEMIGRSCFLFKNQSTGNYSVVYKTNSKGKEGYGIINSKRY